VWAVAACERRLEAQRRQIERVLARLERERRSSMMPSLDG